MLKLLRLANKILDLRNYGRKQREKLLERVQSICVTLPASLEVWE
jgi:hypothetical protein